MPFLGQEGHVLRARRACSELLLRPFCNREGHEEGRGEVFLSRWGVLSLTERTEFTEVLSARINSWVSFSLTELTDLTEPFHQGFDPTERLRHTDITERFS